MQKEDYIEELYGKGMIIQRKNYKYGEKIIQERDDTKKRLYGKKII